MEGGLIVVIQLVLLDSLLLFENLQLHALAALLTCPLLLYLYLIAIYAAALLLHTPHLQLLSLLSHLLLAHELLLTQ